MTHIVNPGLKGRTGVQHNVGSGPTNCEGRRGEGVGGGLGTGGEAYLGRAREEYSYSYPQLTMLGATPPPC